MPRGGSWLLDYAAADNLFLAPPNAAFHVHLFTSRDLSTPSDEMSSSPSLGNRLGDSLILNILLANL